MLSPVKRFVKRHQPPSEDDVVEDDVNRVKRIKANVKDYRTVSEARERHPNDDVIPSDLQRVWSNSSEAVGDIKIWAHRMKEGTGFSISICSSRPSNSVRGQQKVVICTLLRQKR